MPRASAPAAQAATAAAPMPNAVAASTIPAPTTGFGFAIPPGAPLPKMGNTGADFEATGMADKFNGRCESVWACLRKYKSGKKAESYSLFARVNIRADDPSLGTNGLVSEFYRIDDLRQWVPSRIDPRYDEQTRQWVYTPAGSINGQPVSMDVFRALADGTSGFPSGKFKADGVTPDTAIEAPEDWSGWYIVPGPDNTHDNFAKGTKWEHFKLELEKTGYRARAPHINWADFRYFLVGVYGFWVRLPYSFKGDDGAGFQPDAQGRKPIDPLCLGQIIDLGPISGAGPGPVAGVAPVAAQSLSMPTPTQEPLPPMSPAFAAAVAGAPVLPAQMTMPGTGTLPPPSSASPDAKAQAEALTNQILTQMAAQNPAGLTKKDVGDIVFQQAGMHGLGALNSADWMIADERTFAYNPERGLILPL